MNSYDYGYEYYGGSGVETAIVLGILFFSFLFAVVLYVINAIFLMKLLKNAGHKTPIAAWVPLWNTVSLMELGGIRQPWIWALIFFAGSAIGGAIPVVGVVLSLAVMVAAIIVTVYLAKGVQAALGIDSVGGIVLAVLLPVIWVIWMAIASGKVQRYNVEAAVAQGASMPINWVGNSDVYAPFGLNAPAYAQGHQGYQSQGYQAPQAQGYAAPQPNDPYSAPQQGYGQGQAPYAAPAMQSDWNLSPEQKQFNAPAPAAQPETPQGYEATSASAEARGDAPSFPEQFSSSTSEAPAPRYEAPSEFGQSSTGADGATTDQPTDAPSVDDRESSSDDQPPRAI